MTRLNWSAPALVLFLAFAAMPAEAQLPDLKKKVGEINVQAGTAEFRDITIGAPDTGSLSIGRIAFVGFSRTGERVKADRVDMERLTGKVGARTVEVPTLTITGFEGSSDLFRALTEGGSADRDWIALIQQATAAQITVERLLDHNPALFFESIVNTFTVTGLKDGMIASARLAGMTGESKAPGGPASVKLGELRYQGVNFGEMMRLFSGGGSGNAKMLLERATLDGIDMTTPEGTFRFDRLEMAGIAARAPSTVLDPADRAALQSGAAFDDPARRQRLVKYLAELISSVRIDRYSLEGFSLAAPEGKFTIKGFTFAGWTGRGLDLFEIRSVDAPTPTGPVRVGRFAIEKLTYGPLLDAVLGAVASGQDPDFDSPAKIIEIAPRIAAVRLAGVEVTTPEGPVTLGSFDIELDDRAGVIPERIATAIKQLKVQINRASSDEGRKQLLALGYSEFIVDAQTQLRWVKADKALILENTNLVLDKVGRIDLAVRLGNVDLASAVADPTAFVPDNARVESIEIRLRNLGVAERFYALTAKTAGISQDAVREGLAAEMKARAAAMLGSALTAGSADMLAKFLKAPVNMTIRAVPKPGKTLTIGEVSDMNPPAILEALAITIETTGN